MYANRDQHRVQPRTAAPAARRTRALCVLLLFAAAVTAAAEEQWRRIDPTRIVVDAVALDPSTPRTVYAALRDGVFKSTDGGESWRATSLAVPVMVLAIDPLRAETVYAGGGGGVFRSPDGGATWSPIGADAALALAVHPEIPGVVYAGGYGGLMRSRDGGATWTVVADLPVLTLAIGSAPPHAVYAGGYGGAIKSTDGGDTWTAMHVGLPLEGKRLHVGTLAIAATHPETLYVRAWTRWNTLAATWPVYLVHILASTDGGSTWSAIEVPEIFATALAVGGEELYVVAERRVLASGDGGATWRVSDPGLQWTSQAALAVAPSAPSTVYVAAQTGVFRSDDGAATWSATHNGLPPGEPLAVDMLAVDPRWPGTVYAFTDWGLYRSSTSGAAWPPAGELPGGRFGDLILDPQRHEVLYVAGESALFRSDDAGRTWAPASPDLSLVAGSASTPAHITSLARAPATGAFYAGFNNGRVMHSADGQSWEPAGVPFSGAAVTSLVVDAQAPSTVCAIAASYLFQSIDGGTSWHRPDTILRPVTTPLVSDPLARGSLYVGTSSGVWTSADGGRSWSVMPGLSKAITALALAPHGPTLYAGWDGGVRSSADGGASWVERGAGLEESSVVTLAVDASSPPTLYVGTRRGAVYAQRVEAAPRPVCEGDCNGDRQVGIAELIAAVGAALGDSPTAGGTSCDWLSAEPGIDAILRAVQRALDGCPGTVPVNAASRGH